jgi:hypothetical protein
VHVRVELSLPGEELVVSHEPTLRGTLEDAEEDGHRKDDDMEAVHQYALVAVHEAFETTHRRLQDFAQRQGHDVSGSPRWEFEVDIEGFRLRTVRARRQIDDRRASRRGGRRSTDRARS